jgi:plasmid stability protein
MAAMTVRNIPDEMHEALKRRAKKHGRSAEAEVREILREALAPSEKLKLGTELTKLGRKLAEAGLEFEPVRDMTPARYVDFNDPG